MTAHLLILYPNPRDSKTFDRAYKEEHLPYAGPRLEGATGVASRKVAAPKGAAVPYYALSDVSFPSLAALQECAGSTRGKEALAHAASISTGGPPVVLVLTDDLAS
jgi:uncharacterized protein (TIGR02118 family)